MVLIDIYTQKKCSLDDPEYSSQTSNEFFTPKAKYSKFWRILYRFSQQRKRQRRARKLYRIKTNNCGKKLVFRDNVRVRILESINIWYFSRNTCAIWWWRANETKNVGVDWKTEIPGNSSFLFIIVQHTFQFHYKRTKIKLLNLSTMFTPNKFMFKYPCNY